VDNDIVNLASTLAASLGTALIYSGALISSGALIASSLH
jgi:hypothetical protein